MKDDNQLSPWEVWSYQVQQKLKSQDERIAALEAALRELTARLKKLEEKPKYTIENIQYHFDQLKVEKLEGTLNIGMSAPELEAANNGENENGESTQNVDQLSVGEGNVFPAADPIDAQPDAAYQDVMGRLERFLESEANQLILNQEQTLELPLDPHHRRIIIEDIRKQLPPRIQFYMQANQQGGQDPSLLYPDLMTERVYAKTRRDAETAICAYLQRLKSGNPSNGG
ncbi:spore germination protein GerPC [Paenibacillus soyae]|uniref:Spore germination protein GerPC n=1 Tax=Paenibacillus soyae TaxID=2969249 RepID=A0A9X2MN63_9BACL|nr:spore germination protein GerPC [Paenibacillus soyae]MCR2803147.1 spore germination protein GerPC [Paenibacillus soyae]